MDYRVLGPLQLVGASGEPLVLRGDRQRLLLAVLLLRAPRVAGSDGLVEVLWPVDGPADPLAALRTQVSRLRSFLAAAGAGRDAIRSEAHGYRLAVGADAVDAGRFEALLRRSVDATSVEARLGLLDAALALWRGDAYEEFADLLAFQGERARLDALRAGAGEQRIECLLALGRARDAVAAAEPLVERDPLRERPRSLLMQALYAAGRQAEALAVFQDYRRLLSEELGLDPSPALRALETRLLRHESAPGDAPGADGSGIAAGSVPVPVVLPAPPEPITRLIGRGTELEHVGGLLASTRLLTLTGAGGSGKTRLAMEVARAVGARDGGPVAWLPLDGLSDGAALVAHVAALLGVRDRPARALLDGLVDALQGRAVLLVLDNCEHVVEACAALVDALLRRCAAVSVLATSREPIGIAGEVTYPVPPLEAPGPGALAHDVEAYPAVRLFVERATAAVPAFRLTAATAPAVARICHALDGIPLALELAAARVRSLGLDALVERLDRALELTAPVGRTVRPRHRTLRAAIDWSHDLLSEAERDAFAQLAVFAGGFTLAAAASVVRVDGHADAVDLVGALVDRSLVVATSADGGTRYRLLETVRAYALERLAERGGVEAVRRRHAEHFAGLAEAAEPHLLGAQRRAWLARLSAEQDNLRAALRWALDSPPAGASAARLAGALWWFAHARGRILEARTWIERALALPGVSDDAAIHAKLRHGAAMAAWIGGDAEAAGIHATEGLRTAEALGEPYALMRALAVAAWLRRDAGDTAAAVGLADACADVARRGGLPPGELGYALWLQGSVHYTAGSFDVARSVQEEALARWRAEGVHWGLSQVLHGLAVLALDEGRLDDAARLCREALAGLDDEGDAYWACRVLEGLAAVLARQGRPAKAARLLAATEALREPIGAPLLVFETPRHEETVARLRSQLGEDGLAAEWACGRGYPLERAVAHALEPDA